VILPLAVLFGAHWVENRRKLIELRNAEDGLKKYALKGNEESLAIRATLNQYELIAVGINAGILDEEMYRLFYRGTLIKDWRASSEFVHEERKENSQYWVQLEDLVKRYQET
jgi:hypothetical protein